MEYVTAVEAVRVLGLSNRTQLYSKSLKRKWKAKRIKGVWRWDVAPRPVTRKEDAWQPACSGVRWDSGDRALWPGTLDPNAYAKSWLKAKDRATSPNGSPVALESIPALIACLRARMEALERAITALTEVQHA